MSLHIEVRAYRMFGPGPYPPNFRGYILSSEEIGNLVREYRILSVKPRRLKLQGIDGAYTIEPTTLGGRAFTHIKQVNGKCRICGHYGADCTARKSESDLT